MVLFWLMVLTVWFYLTGGAGGRGHCAGLWRDGAAGGADEARSRDGTWRQWHERHRAADSVLQAEHPPRHQTLRRPGKTLHRKFWGLIHTWRARENSNAKPYDVACVQCEHSHSRTRVPFALRRLARPLLQGIFCHYFSVRLVTRPSVWNRPDISMQLISQRVGHSFRVIHFPLLATQSRRLWMAFHCTHKACLTLVWCGGWNSVEMFSRTIRSDKSS